jgi:hypothetical protein
VILMGDETTVLAAEESNGSRDNQITQREVSS